MTTGRINQISTGATAAGFVRALGRRLINRSEDAASAARRPLGPTGLQGCVPLERVSGCMRACRAALVTIAAEPPEGSTESAALLQEPRSADCCFRVGWAEAAAERWPATRTRPPPLSCEPGPHCVVELLPCDGRMDFYTDRGQARRITEAGSTGPVRLGYYERVSTEPTSFSGLKKRARRHCAGTPSQDDCRERAGRRRVLIGQGDDFRVIANWPFSRGRYRGLGSYG